MHTLHRVTVAQFARMLVQEARRRRKLTGVRGCLATPHDLADVSGYNHLWIQLWECGKRAPKLRESLDLLEAVVKLA